MHNDDVILSIENVSKRYFLGHESHHRERYHSLRDTVSRYARDLGRKAIDMARGRQIIQGDEIEEFWALKDVSFDVKRGEVLGIIGRNGAGKSTLLKILSRVTEPTEGRVTLRGRVASLLEVGTGFHPELTGRENVYLNGAILGMSKREIKTKFDEIVHFAEVEKFLDTPVKRYSSGMYVRLAFAVAAHLEPEILVIDEVLAVGDAQFQKKCLGKMGDVARGGRTVLFVSHNMGAIRNLCSEVIWLSKGRIEERGSAAKLVDSYLRLILDKSSLSLDLANTKRPAGMSGRLKIRSVEFNGGTPIQHGEPLSVKIEFETAAAVPDVAFGFGFSSAEGIRVMTVDSDLLESQRDLPKDHVGIVKATILHLHLQPDRYLVDLGARSGNDSALDYLPACAQIEVLPGPNTPPLIIRETGGMRIPAQWQWRETGTTTALASDTPESEVGSHAIN